MPPRRPDQIVYRRSTLSEKSTASSLWKPPASASVSVAVRPAGSFEIRTMNAAAMPAKMTLIWYFWVRLTAALPPVTV